MKTQDDKNNVTDKDKYAPEKTEFIKRLRAVGPSFVISPPGHRVRVNGIQRRVLAVPGLAEARCIFEKSCGLSSSVWAGLNVKSDLPGNTGGLFESINISEIDDFAKWKL